MWRQTSKKLINIGSDKWQKKKKAAEQNGCKNYGVQQWVGCT
jgi:hypothetical protein